MVPRSGEMDYVLRVHDRNVPGDSLESDCYPILYCVRHILRRMVKKFFRDLTIHWRGMSVIKRKSCCPGPGSNRSGDLLSLRGYSPSSFVLSWVQYQLSPSLLALTAVPPLAPALPPQGDGGACDSPVVPKIRVQVIQNYRNRGAIGAGRSPWSVSVFRSSADALFRFPFFVCNFSYCPLVNPY